jgi:hypothetical protein
VNQQQSASRECPERPKNNRPYAAVFKAVSIGALDEENICISMMISRMDIFQNCCESPEALGRLFGRGDK